MNGINQQAFSAPAAPSAGFQPQWLAPWYHTSPLMNGSPMPPQPPQPPPQPPQPPPSQQPPIGRGGMSPDSSGARPMGRYPEELGGMPLPYWPPRPPMQQQPQWMPAMPQQTPHQWMNPMQWSNPWMAWQQAPSWPPEASMGWAGGAGAAPMNPGAPAGWLTGQMFGQPGYGQPIMPPPQFPQDGRAIDGGPMPQQQISPPGAVPPWQAPWYGQSAF